MNSNSYPSILQEKSAVCEMAVQVVEQLTPVILLQPGTKRPVDDPETGSWLIRDDPCEVVTTIEALPYVPNLGAMLHPRNSHLICLDIEALTSDVLDLLRRLDISTKDRAWRQRTGKGGMHIFYLWMDDPLPRIANKPDGLDLDCLSNGYAIIAPSDTSRNPKGGGPYSWLPGHSPFEILMDELEPPPDAMIDWWRNRSKGGTATAREDEVNDSTPKAWNLLNQGISEGGRNESLTKIAGWLRQYHPPQVLEALLLAINDGRCSPSLDEAEVRNIARSISRYPQAGVNGHPRAVVPMFTREGG